MLTMKDVDLAQKRVLIRQDLNVAQDKQGRITYDGRIRASLPTIQKALDAGAGVIVMSHLGRPKAGEDNSHLSLRPVAERLQSLLDQPVRFEAVDWPAGINVEPGEVVVLENTRFYAGEKDNDPQLARAYANLCDVVVMDAFATAHRAEASTEGVIHQAQVACAGPLLMQEVQLLHHVMYEPKRPLAAVVGGSKVSTKLKVLHTLAQRVDTLLVGGGILNTFLAAQGYAIGQSLYEPELIDEARSIIRNLQDRQAQLVMPQDVVVAERLDHDVPTQLKAIDDIAEHDMILDIGETAQKTYAQSLSQAQTIIWNGPAGAFEIPAFSKGTICVAQAIAQASNNPSVTAVAGGGDTLSALQQYQIDPCHIRQSTGGSAFLAYLAGQTLPTLAALGV